MGTPALTRANDVHSTFGAFLRYLRRRARLTQRELAMAVNYSEGQICHLEHDRRAPDLATLAALFVPALGLEDAPADTARLLDLASAARSAARAGAAPQPPARPTTKAFAPTTPLIGRAAQRTDLAARLTAPETRLLTLTGPPGVGKTHLALQLAQDLGASFAGGAHFIDLSAITEVEQVLPAVARGLGLDEDPRGGAQTVLLAALGERPTLLILDNVEQVADAAPQLAELLAGAPGLTMLLTSRITLRLRAEHVVSLPPLAVPDLGQLPPLAELAQVESVALLLARLQAVSPGLAVTPGNALALAAICVRVDGLPLAIELVAAYGRLLGPQELLREVEQQFQQLRRRGRDVPPRHQSLAAALSWSYGQLSPPARILLARLSVFSGRWPVEAVRPVCDLEGAGHAALMDALNELVGHSLLQRHSDGDGSQLGMLAMVREFAQEQLGARGEHDRLHRRLLAVCIERAEHAEERLIFSAEQALWMARMEGEYATIRSALAWAVGSGANGQAVRLAGAMWRYWYMRGMLREGRRWLETVLALTPDGPATARAHALDGLAVLAWRQGEYAQADTWLQLALDLYRGEGHQRGEARVLSHIGLLAAERGALEQALGSYETSARIYRELGDSIGEASVLHNLGNLACQRNEHDQALTLYGACLAIYERHGTAADIALVSLGIGAVARDQGHDERARAAFARSLELAQALGDEWTAATALLNLGDIAGDCGESGAARGHYAEALAIYRRLGDQQQVAMAQARLALAAYLGGDIAAAVELYRQSLMLANALGFDPGVAEGLEGLASCAARSQPLLAARLFARAAALREEMGLPVSVAEQARYDQALYAARHVAGPDAWQAAWHEGRALSLGQAIALALTRVS
jgi:predicted ATPase/transcriptional regulator with XRE-family HTH domain